MKSSVRLRHLVAAAAVTAAGAASATSPSAHADVVPVDTSRIDVPAGNRQFLAVHATGVQIYSCTLSAGSFAWSLVAPRADLRDDKGKLVGTHFGGPTWKYQDGSIVVGKKVDGVTVDPTAIPWLLIHGESWAAAADGDRFTNVTYVQRLNTVGGQPPAAPTCNSASLGDVREVGYTADYTFWRKSRA